MRLAQTFFDYFDLFEANTEDLKEVAYRIRYEVYCDELGYEDVDAFPNQQEKDAADDFSHHYLIRHKSTGIYAGTIRVIHPTQPGQKTCMEHPFCLAHIIDKDRQPNQFELGTYAEVSRLAVPAVFRRRLGDFFYATRNPDKDGKAVENERRMFSHIAIGLYLAAMAHIQLNGQIEHVYFVMERALGRHLKQQGIACEQIGATFNYRGKRAPFYCPAETSSEHMPDEIKDLYQSIRAYLHKEKVIQKVS